MSLYINVDLVTEVLLADGWHAVADDSFTLDSYEFHWNDQLLLRGGQVDGVPSTGFFFIEHMGDVVTGPLTSVLAVRTRRTA